MARRLAFSTARILLVSIENGSSSLTHNCHSCLDEVERLEWYLRDLRSMLTQCQQVPDTPHVLKCFLTFCLSMIQK